MLLSKELQHDWFWWTALVPWDIGYKMPWKCTTNSMNSYLRNGWAIQYARLLLLLISRRISLQREKGYPRRKLKEITASLDLRCLSKNVSECDNNHLVRTKRVLRNLQFSKNVFVELSRVKVILVWLLRCLKGLSKTVPQRLVFFESFTGPTWSAKKQSTIALSTAETQYVALGLCM